MENTPHKPAQAQSTDNNLRPLIIRLAICAMVASIVCGFAGGLLGVVAARAWNAQDQYAPWWPWNRGEQTTSSSTRAVNEDSAIINVATSADPAVVSIIVSKNLSNVQQIPFGPFGYYQIKGQSGTEKTEIGGGSGFIATNNGHIITNKHVVSDNNAEYTVLTNDGKEYPATILATDPVLDIAILKIDVDHELPTLPLGNSDELRVGQRVIAIGNALGEFQNTVSAGIVSGLHRSITASDAINGQNQHLNGIIQTDAAINQGNSGGPLLDLDGRVVGMNTANASNGENIGFAIPVNEITRDLEQVLEQNKIILPYIGIRYVMLNDRLATRYGIDITEGAFIVNGSAGHDAAIAPNSPASRVDLRERDIITAIDDAELTETNDLASVLRRKRPQDTVTLTIIRDGQKRQLSVTLEERPQ